MLDAIQSKAGLIGYYEGTIKTTLRTLRQIPEEQRSWDIKSTIEQLERTLEQGDEVWLRVRGRE